MKITAENRYTHLYVRYTYLYLQTYLNIQTYVNIEFNIIIRAYTYCSQFVVVSES
jgi:hypothetical protein